MPKPRQVSGVNSVVPWSRWSSACVRAGPAPNGHPAERVAPVAWPDARAPQQAMPGRPASGAGHRHQPGGDARDAAAVSDHAGAIHDTRGVQRRRGHWLAASLASLAARAPDVHTAGSACRPARRFSPRAVLGRAAQRPASCRARCARAVPSADIAAAHIGARSAGW
eukprot:3057337-Prymnesium_polylepis.2